MDDDHPQLWMMIIPTMDDDHPQLCPTRDALDNEKKKPGLRSTSPGAGVPS